jgi:phosphoglycolate phosphatase-like HAD superfamily hydrolase
MGMGGDQLVAAVAGEDAERRHGDDVRSTEHEIFMGMIGEVEPLPLARELLLELRRGARRVVLASSANADEVDHYLDLLRARELVEGWTTSADVDRTKPQPDVIEAARARLRPEVPAVVIGDSRDCLAARRAELPVIGLLTGGYSEQELREAGAGVVYTTLGELISTSAIRRCADERRDRGHGPRASSTPAGARAAGGDPRA